MRSTNHWTTDDNPITSSITDTDPDATSDSEHYLEPNPDTILTNGLNTDQRSTSCDTVTDHGHNHKPNDDRHTLSRTLSQARSTNTISNQQAGI